MDLDDFNKNFLNKLLEKVSKEQKSVYLLGDFNVNLLNYKAHPPTNEFLDSLAPNLVIPYILKSTRIRDHSVFLIDNIFSNVITVDAISGNLTATISDHLPQIMIVPNVLADHPSNRSNIYERDWPNFDQVSFVLDYLSIDWDDTLKIKEENIDYSSEVFLNKISNLLGCYAPFKKICKYKLKFKTKPWITPGLQKSISTKNKLLTKYIKMKDHEKKFELHNNYKNQRNLLSSCTSI